MELEENNRRYDPVNPIERRHNKIHWSNSWYQQWKKYNLAVILWQIKYKDPEETGKDNNKAKFIKWE